eukprot:6214787-Pleurochrysis_carterae.AAC.3
MGSFTWNQSCKSPSKLRSELMMSSQCKGYVARIRARSSASQASSSCVGVRSKTGEICFVDTPTLLAVTSAAAAVPANPAKALTRAPRALPLPRPARPPPPPRPPRPAPVPRDAALDPRPRAGAAAAGKAFQPVRRADGFSTKSVAMIMTQCAKTRGPPGLPRVPLQSETNASPFHFFSSTRRPCDFARQSSFSRSVRAVREKPFERRVTQVDVRPVQRVQDHVVRVAMHQGLAIFAGLDVEVVVRVVESPLLVPTLAGLLLVLKQRFLLGNEPRVCRVGGSCCGMVVHEGATWRYAWAWKGAQLRLVRWRSEDGAERLARAAAEAAVSQMLAMTKAC